MNEFDKLWRTKVAYYTEQLTNKEVKNEIKKIDELDSVKYSQKLIKSLKNLTSEKKIKNILACSACNLPHVKLHEAKMVYEKTGSISKARDTLEKSFIKDIKLYKNLTDEQANEIINRGWGLAGIIKDDKIIATKIPSMLHEYFNETDPIKKKYYYCHCPRVRKELLKDSNLDPIYCNCGGGFYKNVWEYITSKPVEIKILKNLFSGSNTCQFEVSFQTN